jgi:transcriptional regulator of aromatic amino acid metabolism
MNILEINTAAKKLLGIEDSNLRMKPASDYFDTVNFIIAMSKEEKCEFQRVYIPKTDSYINQTISLLNDKRVLFSVMTDITSQVNYNERLVKVKQDTLSVTDNVIKKQMRVAQEIASLLGETTAETKVALLKLKTMLQEEERQEI